MSNSYRNEINNRSNKNKSYKNLKIDNVEKINNEKIEIPLETPVTPIKHTFYKSNKTKALDIAKQNLINEIIEQISLQDINKINTNLTYLLNYQKTINIDISNDNMEVQYNGETYNFSKNKFITNSYFKGELQDKLLNIIYCAKRIRFFIRGETFNVKFSIN
jgi:hypothetical protein